MRLFLERYITDCGGAEYARSNGIPVLVFPKAQRESSDGLSPTELVDVLRLRHLSIFISSTFSLDVNCVTACRNS